jgi:hypothetical protein
MALIQLGPLAQQISGRLGAVVFHAGARADVIARAPTPHSLTTERQLNRRAAFTRARKFMLSQPETTTAAWNAYRKGLSNTNRLGVPKRPTTLNAMLAYNMATDYNAQACVGTWYPPSYLRTPDQTIDALAFAQGGPYNVTLASLPAATTLEYTLCYRQTLYARSGRMPTPTYAGMVIRDALTEDWYSTFIQAGLDLATGEEITLVFWWVIPTYYHSGRITATTTVT